jgi:hypothetical protein
MNVQLDPLGQKRLEDLARASGKPAETLASELLEEALSSREVEGGNAVRGDEDALARKQRQAHMEFLREMEALPLEGPDDGFSGADHDRVPYGGKS